MRRVNRCGQNYLECSPGATKEILDPDLLSKNAKSDPGISQGVNSSPFFGMTVDGCFTSEIGIKDLGYVGNTFVKGKLAVHPCPKIELKFILW